eukprot:5423324-Alexandrium_andersonii.AAC.1
MCIRDRDVQRMRGKYPLELCPCSGAKTRAASALGGSASGGPRSCDEWHARRSIYACKQCPGDERPVGRAGS